MRIKSINVLSVETLGRECNFCEVIIFTILTRVAVLVMGLYGLSMNCDIMVAPGAVYSLWSFRMSNSL